MTTEAAASTSIPTQSRRLPTLEAAVRLRLYETMVLSRTYEEAILREYHADKGPGFDIGKGLIPGEMHLSAGQEPVAAGVCAHLTTDDAVTATHRPHHFAIAHGIDLNKMTAEIFGRETGLGRGRGGHMHLFDPATHFSCSGIIAEGYPPALGQAFAFKRRGTDRIAVAVTGEGAANQGAFHESLNLAAKWSLPVVFVVEDNDWGISVPRDVSTSVASNADRGTEMPQSLSSITNTTGSDHWAARFSDSWKPPWLAAPSPVTATATRSVPLRLNANACPNAGG
jgi:pyruvate dehydrogenase E1 component alpha subunit